MFKRHLVFSAAAILVVSCANHAPTSGSNSSSGTANAPVETKPANTNYTPAFTGQTRIGSVKTTTAFEGKVLSSGLNRPWGLTALPDGRLLITEKSGTMRLASTSGALSAPISGMPAVNAAGQGGLLGVTVDPQFSTNRMVYWTFAENTPEGNLTAVGKGTLSADDARIENATVIYRATPAYRGNLHYGSRILFDAAGNLFVSTGERSDLQTRPQAQDVNSGLGKIIRITTEGRPVPGNPFMNRTDARPELYSYGHRNVEGLAIHPQTGELWNSEMGPKGGDEINVIKPGLNYGWPTITYGVEYSGDKVGAGITRQNGLEQPVYYWDPVLSPSGMTFYSADNIPEWKNNLFIGGLNSKHIARIVIRDNKVVGEERLLANEGQRFRDIAQGKDGALYAVTDEGRLYRIGKK